MGRFTESPLPLNILVETIGLERTQENVRALSHGFASPHTDGRCAVFLTLRNLSLLWSRLNWGEPCFFAETTRYIGGFGDIGIGPTTWLTMRSIGKAQRVHRDEASESDRDVGQGTFSP